MVAYKCQSCVSVSDIMLLSINQRPKRSANDAPEVIAENLKVMRENQRTTRGFAELHQNFERTKCSMSGCRSALPRHRRTGGGRPTAGADARRGGHRPRPLRPDLPRQGFMAISWREANETAMQESPFIAMDSSQTRMDACLCPQIVIPVVVGSSPISHPRLHMKTRLSNRQRGFLLTADVATL